MECGGDAVCCVKSVVEIEVLGLLCVLRVWWR